MCDLEAQGTLPCRSQQLCISRRVRWRCLTSEQEIDGEYLFPSTFLEDLEDRVRGYLSSNEKLLVTDLKAMVGATRKHALPLARWLDDAGVTIRRADHRILRR